MSIIRHRLPNKAPRPQKKKPRLVAVGGPSWYAILAMVPAMHPGHRLGFRQTARLSLCGCRTRLYHSSCSLRKPSRKRHGSHLRRQPCDPRPTPSNRLLCAARPSGSTAPMWIARDLQLLLIQETYLRHQQIGSLNPTRDLQLFIDRHHHQPLGGGPSRTTGHLTAQRDQSIMDVAAETPSTE